MKIIDCFMYFDEEVVLNVRLNHLYNYVDYFVIVESKFTHKGEERSLKFDINKLIVNFEDPFIPRRGRINCSLMDNGKWRWFGTQFIVSEN